MNKNFFSFLELKATTFEDKPLCEWLNKTRECTGDLIKYRTIDGACNNLKETLYGLAGTPFQRILEDADYNKNSKIGE